MRPSTIIGKVLQGAESLGHYGLLASCVVGFVAVIMVVLETIFRNGHIPVVPFSDEYSGYLLVFITFLAASSSVRSGYFVRLNVVTQRLPKRAQDILNILAYALGVLVLSFYLWRCFELFVQSLQRHTTSVTSLYTPLAFPQFFMIMGLVLTDMTLGALLITEVSVLVSKSRGKSRGQPESQ